MLRLVRSPHQVASIYGQDAPQDHDPRWFDLAEVAGSLFENSGLRLRHTASSFLLCAQLSSAVRHFLGAQRLHHHSQQAWAGPIDPLTLPKTSWYTRYTYILLLYNQNPVQGSPIFPPWLLKEGFHSKSTATLPYAMASWPHLWSIQREKLYVREVYHFHVVT